ncbi:TolC family protein [Sulfurimonas sp.]
MKKLLFLLLPILMYGENLHTLLEYAKQNNNLIHASSLSTAAKHKELESTKKSYYPTLDASTFYQRDDDATPFQAGTTYGASAIVSWNVYDGGKRSHSIEEKNAAFHAQKYTHKDMQKQITLSITKAFFNIKSMLSLLDAKEDASKAVKKQLQRMKSFYAAQLATSDDVDRLQSAYDKNIYEIESLKLQILSAKKMLELQVGKKINSFDDSSFVKNETNAYKELPSIKALKSSKRSLRHASQIIQSAYYPNITLTDQYTLYGYANRPTFANQAIPLLDSQNTIKATLTLRLIDFGRLREQKEAVELQADALHEQICYKSKEQQIQLDLAKERIKTAKLNIKSAKSAYKAAASALTTITQKYKAGIVDNVVYLDALSNNTSAKALYEKSRNDLEIAYAIYYYYQGKNLEEKVL